MKRLFSLAIALTLAMGAIAQRGQDFASRFMQQCEGDTAIHCVTVSPKMMEQLTKQADKSRQEDMAEAIEKLKSARIVTAAHGESYYQLAEDLLKRNQQRFSHYRDYRSSRSHGSFYLRKLRNGSTVELIMLHADSKTGAMVIVNVTGDIDEEFINSLLNAFGSNTAKASSARQQKDISKLSL